MRMEVSENPGRSLAEGGVSGEGGLQGGMEPGGPVTRSGLSEGGESCGSGGGMGVPRGAWVEIDLGRLRGNMRAIRGACGAGLRWLSVVKDAAYGHGAVAVARVAMEEGAEYLGVSTVGEGVELREAGLKGKILLMGDREVGELPWCVEHDLVCCVTAAGLAEELGRVAVRFRKQVPVHVKVNTGMNRYGIRWTEAGGLAARIAGISGLRLEGVLSHFAQSDEADKTFARVQRSRFEEALKDIEGRGIRVPVKHLCNSGGFLDLPEAHYDMVRVGILALGVFPSAVCRRLAGIEPVMSVKARVAAIQDIEVGDTVGYGMRFTAATRRRIAVLPLGYGDGYPRVRNLGHVLVRGRRAPLVGGVAMDALTVDVTDIPGVELNDEAVLMGRQGAEEIGVHEVARWKSTVSYDVLVGWRSRLPRVYLR